MIEDWLWRDQGRMGKLWGVGSLLLGLGIYHAYISMTMVFGYRECLEDIAKNDGATLIFPLWEVTRIDGPGQYAISKVVKDIPILGETTDLHMGATVSVVGHFRGADRVVVEERKEIHVLRVWKERLGILGAALVIGAAPLTFRWRAGRLEERG